MKNTTIKIAMLVLVATFTISLGMANGQATTMSGTTTIQLERTVQPVSPELERLTELQVLKENADAQEKRDAIQAQQDAIMKKIPRTEEQINEERTGNQKANQLTDSILAKRGEFVVGGENYIPFTIIGYYPKEHALKIGIHEDFVNQENMEKYADEIRAMVGNDIDIIVHNGGQYSEPDTCASRTSNCTPMQAGIQIQVENHGYCTLGFSASRTVSFTTYEGFVTAGHCADDETNSDVGQATTSRVIGTVQIETYDYGSSNEYCDCAFVEIESGSVALDQEIYGVSSQYYPDHVGSASVDDYVKQSGKTSGIKIGQVLSTSVSSTNSHGTTLRDVVHANYARAGGDSGAPIMDAFSGDPGFLGIHVAGNNNPYPDPDDAFYVKYSNLETYLGGSLTWNLAP